MAALSANAEELKSAFEVFNRQSDMLEQSYRQLQSKVETLTRQLRREQSARLAELEKKERLSRHLSELLESLPGAIVVIDGDGVIREHNTEASVLLKQPLLGCAWAQIVQREVQSGSSEDGNLLLHDGRWLSLSRRSLAHEPGEVLLLADITESRQMSALRQRQERLTCIGEMTAKFAHQVRTPLASAMLYAAQVDTTTTRQQRVVDKISARLSDIGRMVNDMLGFAAGARRPQETVPVGELLTEVRSAIETQLDEQTRLSVNVADDDLCVAANKNSLKGALMNLITNADQACGEQAEITLGAEIDDVGVLFSVSDNGPGIPADVMPRLFEPFFTTRPQGTGLGLAVVQAVAAAHDGEVGVSTSPAGSRFTIRIPAAAGRNADVEND